MIITFQKPKQEQLANNYDMLCRKYNKKGTGYAEDIRITLNALLAAETLHDVPPVFRPHPLQGRYKGCFSVSIDKKHRLIFEPDHEGDPCFRIDNYKSIKKIKIIEIFKDYH